MSGLLALALTIIAIKSLERPALNLGLVDAPGGRKVHARPVPLIGGMALLLAFVIATLTLPVPLRPYAGLYVGIAVVAAIGLIDDASGLPVLPRFSAQILLALVVVMAGGPVIGDLGRLPGSDQVVLALGPFALPVTVVAIVGFMNGLNMMDGADGLAGGVALVILLGLAAAALLAGDTAVPAMAVVLAAAVTGFLLFNLRGPWRRRASVFLGDSGSLALGFAVIWLVIETAMLPDRVVSPLGIGWLVAVPVIETLNVMMRRLLRGQSPFRADREHLHHILLRAGFSVAQTTALIVALVAVLGGIGISASALGVDEGWLWLGLLAMAVVHLVFTERGWRLLLAVRRLQRRPPLSGTRRWVVGRPLSPWRQTIALSGFYLLAAMLPFRLNAAALGLVLVTLAVVMPGAFFTRTLVREPVAWVAAGLAGLGVIQGLMMSTPLDGVMPIVALSGVMALPLGWWLASSPVHILGGGSVLVVALATATGLRSVGAELGAFASLVNTPDAGLALLAALPLVACLVTLSWQIIRMQRRRRCCRPRDLVVAAATLGLAVWLARVMADGLHLGEASSDLVQLAQFAGPPGLVLFALLVALLLVPTWRLARVGYWPYRWTLALQGVAVLQLSVLAVAQPLTSLNGALALNVGLAVLVMGAIQHRRLSRASAS